jgi:hypothetical protein
MACSRLARRNISRSAAAVFERPLTLDRHVALRYVPVDEVSGERGRLLRECTAEANTSILRGAQVVLPYGAARVIGGKVKRSPSFAQFGEGLHEETTTQL